MYYLFSGHAQEGQKAELPALSLKLIHSGKILKDEDAISACGIKENEFLVVMVTKAKKPAAVETAVASSSLDPVEATPTAAGSAAAAAAATSSSTITPAPTSASTNATPSAPAATSTADAFPEEVITNLTSMGFPEAEVRHCLRAAHGNPDVAVEFLTNGIPDGVAEAVASSSAATPVASGRPLQALRNHPQFNALRRLVQSNPAALQQVLTQIGQQQPELLAEINSNQAMFLEMMNEPISETAPASSNSSSSSTGRGSAGGGAAMMEGLASNPAQMAQMIEGMSDGELQQMATMMGLPPDQLRATAQIIGQMPPDQLNQFMMQAIGNGGGGSGMGGGGGGRQVLHLTEEEMAAVDRLTEMGFDRSEAAQAFLACDKNEALAANLLMDSMANGGFFGESGNDADDGNGDDDDDDNMYD